MKQLKFSYSREKMFPGFDGKECKIYPQITCTENNLAFLTYCMLLLSGSDVFNDSYIANSTDGGATFAAPEKLPRLETYANGIRTIVASCTEYYSSFHKKWFCFGHRTSYSDDVHPIIQNGISTGKAAYVLRDTTTGHFIGKDHELPLPVPYITAVPHGQVICCSPAT